MSDPASPTRVAAIVPAAGRGERLGPGAPKALREIAGSPMLVYAVKALAASPMVDLVVVAAPADFVEEVRSLVVGPEYGAEVVVVAGGETRSESVARALITLPFDIEIVLVHDAARPLVPVEIVTAVASAVRDGHAAVIPVIPLVDTIKSIDEAGLIRGTVPREQLRATQTPQGFERDLLQRAHAEVEDAVTDDAGMIESLGIPVHSIEGHAESFKVTRPLDVVLAEAVIAKRRSR